MTKSERAIIVRISAQMRKACRGFIGDPLTPEQMERMRSAVNDVLCEFAPYNDCGKYVNVKCDLEDRTKIIITPKRNAPMWVWEVFLMINPKQNEI